VADYSKPGDDGGILTGPVRWDVDTWSRPLELECGKWMGLEVRATQDRLWCGGFNYRKLYERARDIGGDIIARTLQCPDACPNRRGKRVESSWSCERAWVKLWFLRLPLFRAQARVLWAVGCENGRKLPALDSEADHTDDQFKKPYEPADRPGLPGPDHAIEEHHGFRGPPKSVQLPCNKSTIFSYTFFTDDSPCPPADFEPMVDIALADAKLYAESLWCAEPCWPAPAIGVLRKEWGCDDDTVAVTLYILLVCEEGMPEMPDEGM
jgi:hypothetical protein